MRLDIIAQTLPSCGMSVVVSLSRYNPAVWFHRRVLAALFIVAAWAAHVAVCAVSLRRLASMMAWETVWYRIAFASMLWPPMPKRSQSASEVMFARPVESMKERANERAFLYWGHLAER